MARVAAHAKANGKKRIARWQEKRSPKKSKNSCKDLRFFVLSLQKERLHSALWKQGFMVLVCTVIRGMKGECGGKHQEEVRDDCRRNTILYYTLQTGGRQENIPYNCVAKRKPCEDRLFFLFLILPICKRTWLWVCAVWCSCWALLLPTHKGS